MKFESIAAAVTMQVLYMLGSWTISKCSFKNRQVHVALPKTLEIYFIACICWLHKHFELGLVLIAVTWFISYSERKKSAK